MGQMSNKAGKPVTANPVKKDAETTAKQPAKKGK